MLRIIEPDLPGLARGKSLFEILCTEMWRFEHSKNDSLTLEFRGSVLYRSGKERADVLAQLITK